MGARAGQSPSRILTAMSRTRSKIFVSVSPTSHLYWEGGFLAEAIHDRLRNPRNFEFSYCPVFGN